MPIYKGQKIRCTESTSQDHLAEGRQGRLADARCSAALPTGLPAGLGDSGEGGSGCGRPRCGRGVSIPEEQVLLSPPEHSAGGGAAGSVLPVRGGRVDTAPSFRRAGRRQLLLPGCSLHPEGQAAQQEEATLSPDPQLSHHPCGCPSEKRRRRQSGERCICPALPSVGTGRLLARGRIQSRKLFLPSLPCCFIRQRDMVMTTAGSTLHPTFPHRKEWDKMVVG